MVQGLLLTGPTGTRNTVLLSLAAPFAVACLAFALPDRRLPAALAAGVAQLMVALGIPMGAIAILAMLMPPTADRGGLVMYLLFLLVQIGYYGAAQHARKASGKKTASEYFGWGYSVGAIGPVIALLALGSIYGG